MSHDLVVIDYGAGNLSSVAKALRWLGYQPLVTNEPGALVDARSVILPGVGAAGQIMGALRSLELDEAIHDYIDSGRPFLGVCMGMQVLMERSDEDGGQDCLGVLEGKVRRLAGDSASGEALKIPHMGWNTVRQVQAHAVWDGIPDESYFYFVHSYVVEPLDTSVAAGRTEYGDRFVSAVARGNLFGTQFHPEKSGVWGLRLYRNFVEWAAGGAAA